jgi:hypothetical protein
MTADDPKMLLIRDLEAVVVGIALVAALVAVDFNASVVVVTGCVVEVLPESIFCDITLPSLSTVTVFVITAGTLI